MAVAEELQELLRQDAEVVGDGTVAELLSQHYGLTGTLHRLSSERDQNFRLSTKSGPEHLVKITNPAERPEITDFQTCALLHIEAVNKNVAVPRVKRSLSGRRETTFIGGDGRSRTMRVLSYLRGKPLHTVERNVHQVRSLGQCLAKLDLALRGFFHPAAGYILLWDIKQASKVRDLLEHSAADRRIMADAALVRFENVVAPKLLGLRAQVIHNDANAHNVLVSEDDPNVVSGIIDFGDMIYSPLIINVAVAATYQLKDNEVPLSLSAELIGAYNSVLPLQDEEFELLFDLIVTRLAVVIAITSWRAKIYPDNADYILRYNELAGRMLARLASLSPQQAEEYFRAHCKHR